MKTKPMYALNPVKTRHKTTNTEVRMRWRLARAHNSWKNEIRDLITWRTVVPLHREKM